MPSIFRAQGADVEKIVRGQLAFQLKGTTLLKPLGNAMAEFEIQREVTEIKTNEAPERPKLKEIVTDLNGNVKLTLRSMIPMVMALTHMSEAGMTRTQAISTDVLMSFDDVEDGDIANLFGSDGKRAFSVVPGDVTPPGAVRWDEAAGRVEFLGDREEVTVEFSAPAVTATAKKQFLQFLSKGTIEGRLELRQNNANGANHLYVWPLVSLSTSGNFTLIDDGNDVVGVEVTAAIQFDPTQPAGLERGWVEEI